MRTCPNCGHENSDTDRFCSNCGTSLAVVDSATTTPEEITPSPPTSSFPPPVNFNAPPAGASVEDEWRMSNLGPPPPKRRMWMWVLIGIIALCLLSCIGLIGFSLTDSGQEWFENLATEAAEQATEQAN